VESLLKNLWARASLRGIQYNDRYARLDRLYRVEDPWGMDSDREKFRFRETNRLITTNFPRAGSLIEIGCGEGHQSTQLARICDRLFGTDVSRRAVDRAKRRCPSGTFAVGNIFAAPVFGTDLRFDVVVACEVLYYLKDIAGALARMEELGRCCFITYVGEHHARLSSFTDQIPGLRSERFDYEDTHWWAAWWHSRPLSDTFEDNL
jgi:hypothetical protein